jgi:hypothetical protein
LRKGTRGGWLGGNEGRVVGGKGGSGREAITSSLVRRETSSSSRRLSTYIYIYKYINAGDLLLQPPLVRLVCDCVCVCARVCVHVRKERAGTQKETSN